MDLYSNYYNIIICFYLYSISNSIFLGYKILFNLNPYKVKLQYFTLRLNKICVIIML